MKTVRFTVFYILMMFLQVFLSKYCQIGPYIYITMLPAMILCLSTKRPAWWLMIVAFVSGLIVDLISDGVPGLNAAACVGCAAIQKGSIRLCIDDDIVVRGYEFSFRQNGYDKIGLALLAELVVFFTLYIVLDNAGARPFVFNFLKWLLSILCSFVIGMVVCGVLRPRIRR